MATSMWTKFIESRIKYDNPENELHMNFFDTLGMFSRSKKDPNLLAKSLANDGRKVYECREPDKEGFKEYFLYNGSFPKLIEGYFAKRTNKSVSYNNWKLHENYLSERTLTGQSEVKLTKFMFESINTLWFCCLEIFIKNKEIEINSELYEYAFNKVFQIEAEG